MSSQRRLSEMEFIPLVAMLFATIAFSVDAMLPALTVMGAELSPEDPERVTLVVGVFLFGMGVGTFFTGPLSDAFGRRTVILVGFGIYTIGSLATWLATDLEVTLAGRFVQGVAVAAPRIAALAMIRDLYKGERMAAISSYSMMIFIMIPAVAPLIGQSIMNAFGWRAIFLCLIIFALLVASWLAIRQPETLPRDKRVALSSKAMLNAIRECFSDRVFRFSVTVLTLSFTGLFALISSVQPIYAQSFGAEETFPLWFAAAAFLSMPANYINGKLVIKHGMRKLIKRALFLQSIVSVIALVLLLTGNMTIIIFFFWAASLMFGMGFVMGNLTALSLEPMGHIAGLAASVNGALSTIVSAGLAIPIGLAFDGTPLALIIGVLVTWGAGYLLMLRLGPRPPVEA